jgi:hemolysin activation/secretion protein
MSVNHTGTLFDSSLFEYTAATRLTTTLKGYVAGMIPGGSEADFESLRKGATGTFLVIQPGVERVQSLPKDFSLLLHLDGQWTSSPLPPAEAYFAGGMDTVRGYDNYEAVGDYAIRGRAELTTPELFQLPVDRIWQRKKSAEWLFRLRAVAFYDAANLWVANPQPGQLSDFRLEGTGFGIRVKFPKDVGELKLDQGWPLRTTQITQRGDPFVYFSVNVVF